jgi:hypothetical protein
MTKFETWLLKRLLKREVRQGNHIARIQNLYSLIRDAVCNEFTEDNIPTTDAFLRELFEKTQYKSLYSLLPKDNVLDPTPTEFLWVIKEKDKNCTDEERAAAGLLLTMLSRQPDTVAPNGKYY